MTYSKRVVELLQDQKIEEAIKLLIEAIESEPDNPLHLVNLGSLLCQHKQYDQAEQFFLQALQLDEKMATAHFGLATIYYDLAQYDKAENSLKTCITLHLEDAEVYYLLGMTYVKRQNNLLALPFLQRATEFQEDVIYLFQYGLTLAKLQHYDTAKEIFKRILSIDEQHADTLYNLAIVYIHKGHDEDGFNLLKKALEAEPNHSLAKDALNHFVKK